MFTGIITLLSALSISIVAIWYSVLGLTAIFSAAATAIIIMGVSLEVGKLTTVVWLHQNWKTAPRLIIGYLSFALVVLMLITSMGIFGFLSKAHMDQSVPTGDIADKVSLIDEKIKTQRDNIDLSRKALRQMDESVDQVMARSSDEKGADKAASLRRAQAKERATLQADVAKAQKEIAVLNEQRAPIAKELRKVEAEVGPIKYIANFFYGESDKSILEKAVTWVIITLIFVFDPLAIVLLIAAQISLKEAWQRRLQASSADPADVADEVTKVSYPIPVKENQKEDEQDFKFLATFNETSPWHVTNTNNPIDFPKVDKNDTVADEPVTGVEAWNKMIAEAEIEVVKEQQLKVDHEQQLSDEAAQEALKWAQEQESKKKELTWMEKQGNRQVKMTKPE